MREEAKERRTALESFRDERERAFRRMVHYQGQYPGCSTTLLTISPNYHTLYLPHSSLSYFPLSPLPLVLVPQGYPFASLSDNYVPQEFSCDSQSQIDKEDVGGGGGGGGNDDEDIVAVYYRNVAGRRRHFVQFVR